MGARWEGVGDERRRVRQHKKMHDTFSRSMVILVLLHIYSAFAHPFYNVRNFFSPSPSLDVTQIPVHSAGSSSPSPLRYAPPFLSREDSSNFSPRRIASNRVLRIHNRRSMRQ